jgi:hypothetical protein
MALMAVEPFGSAPPSVVEYRTDAPAASSSAMNPRVIDWPVLPPIQRRPCGSSADDCAESSGPT